MKKLAIIFRRAPHGSASGREGLDLALLSASFEQEVSLIFTDEGVLTLLKQQQPELIGCKDYIATLGALPLYDIDTVLVCKQSLKELGLGRTELVIPATICDNEQIRQALLDADEVMVF